MIVSDADEPNHLASWHPLFLVATVNVVFSEKVSILSLGLVPIIEYACQQIMSAYFCAQLRLSVPFWLPYLNCEMQFCWVLILFIYF